MSPSEKERVIKARLRESLGLERNVVVMSAAVFLLGAGEQLWSSFLPKYLEALGAGAVVIGLFGAARDFLDAIYQYPGGFISDRIGARRALILFSSVAALGYAVYAVSPHWPVVFVGLAFVMAWSSMASPGMFAMIADRLPRDRRAMGFTVQSILKRVPMIISPVLGGLLIASLGIVRGIRASLLITIVLAFVAVLTQSRFYFGQRKEPPSEALNMIRQFAAMRPPLKRLLLSDIFVRACEGMTEMFIVLYVINVIGVSPARFGVLVGIEKATAIAVYLPAAWLADRFGRKPFVIATFVCFASLPLVVIASHSFAFLVLAFIIGGLRETGEPARKAMIVDLADPSRRGRTVGLYYLARSLSITPAALIGGLLWKIDPAVPFVVAFFIGLTGAAIFAVTVDRRYAA